MKNYNHSRSSDKVWAQEAKFELRKGDFSEFFFGDHDFFSHQSD